MHTRIYQTLGIPLDNIIDNIALKITSGLMAARDGEILHLLGTEFYRDHGWDGQRSWLRLRWIEGTGLWTEFEGAHHGDRSATAKEHILALTQTS